jgi:hypothetical protein
MGTAFSNSLLTKPGKGLPSSSRTSTNVRTLSFTTWWRAGRFHPANLPARLVILRRTRLNSARTALQSVWVTGIPDPAGKRYRHGPGRRTGAAARMIRQGGGGDTPLLYVRYTSSSLKTGYITMWCVMSRWTCGSEVACSRTGVLYQEGWMSISIHILMILFSIFVFEHRSLAQVNLLGKASGVAVAHVGMARSSVSTRKLTPVKVWITFSGDGVTSTAATWHSAAATVGSFIPFTDSAVTISSHKTQDTFVDAVSKLKGRLEDGEGISHLQFAGHGCPGWWGINGKKAKSKSSGHKVLDTADLDGYLSYRKAGPAESALPGSLNEALDYLRSRMCDGAVIVLKLCDQAGGTDGEDFCRKLSKSLGRPVQACDGKIVGVGMGSWWEFDHDTPRVSR